GIGFQGLARSIEVGGDPAATGAARRFDLARLERIDRVESAVRIGLVGLHLRQGRYAPVRQILGLAHEVAQIAVRLFGATVEREGGDEQRQSAARHFLPPFLSAWEALRWASSSS